MIRRVLALLAALAGIAGSQNLTGYHKAGFPNVWASASDAAAGAWATDSAKKVAAASLDAIHIGVGQQAPTWDSAISIVRARNRPAVIFVDTNILTSAGGALPAVPIIVYSQVGAVLTLAGPDTVKASYGASDLNIIGSVVYAGGANDRYCLLRGSRAGNITLTSGTLRDEGTYLTGGAITVNSGTLEIFTSVVTSQLVHNAGVVLLQNVNFNATKSTALITSNATASTSAFQMLGGSVTNLGSGVALDFSANTQKLRAANALVNVAFKTAAHPVVNMGSSDYLVSDCDTSLVTDVVTGVDGANWGYLGARTLTGDLTPKLGVTYKLGDAVHYFANIYSLTVNVSMLDYYTGTSSLLIYPNQSTGVLAIGGSSQTGGTIIRGGATTIAAAATISAGTNDLNYISSTAYPITLPTTFVSAKEKTFCNTIAYTLVIPSGVTVYGNGTSYTNATKTVAINQVIKLIQISSTVWFITPCTLS